MATTATINLSSDIMATYGGYSKSMTLTKAGTTNDLEETTGFSRRKFTAVTALDLVRMSEELVEPGDNLGAKIYIKNIGDGKGVVKKDEYVLISIGVSDGTSQAVGRLYGNDWLLMPLTVVDGQDVVVTPENENAVVLEYVMFYE
jgi:hypothetical protein